MNRRFYRFVSFNKMIGSIIFNVQQKLFVEIQAISSFKCICVINMHWLSFSQFSSRTLFLLVLFLLALSFRTHNWIFNLNQFMLNHVFIIKYFVSANIEKTALLMVPPPRSVLPKGRGCNTNLQKYFFPV